LHLLYHILLLLCWFCWAFWLLCST